MRARLTPKQRGRAPTSWHRGVVRPCLGLALPLLAMSCTGINPAFGDGAADTGGSTAAPSTAANGTASASESQTTSGTSGPPDVPTSDPTRGTTLGVEPDESSSGSPATSTGGSSSCPVVTDSCSLGDDCGGRPCRPFSHEGVYEGFGCVEQAGDGSLDLGDPCSHLCGDADFCVDDCAAPYICDPAVDRPTCILPCVDPNDCEADETCQAHILGGGGLSLCRPEIQPSCDLILQDCPGGDGCYLIGDTPTCAPEGDAPPYASCKTVNGCQSGFHCLDSSSCTAGPPCCLPLCDASVPSDCDADQTCTPIFGDVGFCESL